LNIYTVGVLKQWLPVCIE